ncbi:MAG: helix-turn-helix domain-containing protein [Candidatus Marinimicrobia bacterium]|nr:helix-turn-helix domain-containing protein [Candidatus Neomarinimicrobiota bacterium]
MEHEANRIMEMLEMMNECQERIEQTVTTMQQERQSPWMKVEEAAKYLKISVRTIYRLTSKGEIPYTQRESESGKSNLYFHRKQLDLWRFTGSVKPNKKQRELYESLV